MHRVGDVSEGVVSALALARSRVTVASNWHNWRLRRRRLKKSERNFLFDERPQFLFRLRTRGRVEVSRPQPCLVLSDEQVWMSERASNENWDKRERTLRRA